VSRRFKFPIVSSAGSIFLKLSHGYTINTKGPDTLVELVENASKEFHTATLPGEWLIDSIPLSTLIQLSILRFVLSFFPVKYLPEWWPGQHFKKVGAKFREHNFEQADRPVEFVKRQMVMIRCLVPQVRSPADAFFYIPG
jgi:hypothetical protein